MKKIRITIKHLFATCIVLGVAQMGAAQTVNTGEMAIMPNTQMGVVNDFENTASGNMFNDGALFIYANFNNDGAFDFLNQGLTTFQGNAFQAITGTSESFMFDVLFSNASEAVPFGLYGQLNVSNEATFEEGIVDNDSNGGIFTFQPNAFHSNTSDISHVNGQVVKLGDQEFEFPIGDEGYFRAAEISAPVEVAATFNGQYFLSDSNIRYDHSSKQGVIEQIDNTEYWVVNRTDGASNIVLTLSWDTDTSPSFITSANPNDIHIVRWDTTQNLWVDEGGIPNPSEEKVSTILPLENYGIFTLAVVNSEAQFDGDLVMYNAISPNGNDMNDYFKIEGIDRFPNNRVSIFNRWGVEVFNTRGYNESDNVFRGFSDGRITMQRGERLPTGTYYYILEYEYEGRTIEKSGYLYINSN